MGHLKGIFLPSTGKQGSPSLDGIYDPLGDQELFTPDRRGSMLKDTNGKLYYPTKGGYQRIKAISIEPFGEASAVTTTDDTGKEIAPGTYPTDGDIVGFKILTVYQNSGGALTFTVMDSAGAVTLYTKSVNNTTYTVLDITDMLLGPPKAGNGTVNGLTVKWSAAAGAAQKVLLQWYYARHVPTTDW